MSVPTEYHDLAAWALAQMAAGLAAPDGVAFPPEYGPALEHYQSGGPDGLRAWLAQPGREHLRQAVFAHRPNGPRPPDPVQRFTGEAVLAEVRAELRTSRDRAEALRAAFARLAALDPAGELALREQARELLDIGPRDYQRPLATAIKQRPETPAVKEEVLWVGQPRELRQVLDSLDGLALTVVPLYVPFSAVSAEFAAAEGEGDRSLEYWRQAHQRFFTRELAAFGRAPTPEMPIVCERFEVVYAG